MARAEKTGVAKLLAVEVCDSAGCTCKQGLRPDYLRIGETTHNGSTKTNLYFSAEFAPEHPVPVAGVPRQHEIIDAFENCEGALTLDSGEIVCGAIAKLRKQI